MADPWHEACSQVKSALKEAFPDFAAEIEPEFLGEPPKPEMGDISSAVCFSIAKKLKKNPNELAKSFSLNKKYPLISGAKPFGGYINFFVDWDEFSSCVLGSIINEGQKYGSTKSFSGKVVVEFPSVNPNKPWHIGHARNAIIGDTISRIFKRAGYDVVRLDYINDLGLQVAKTLWAASNIKLEDTGEKRDHFFGKLYVEAEAKCAADPKIGEEMQKLVGRMEAGNTPEAKKGRELAEKCVIAQYETASRLNVGHDLMVWESDLVACGLLSEAMKKMLECSHIRKLDEGDKAGCTVADLSGFPEFSNVKEPYSVLTRSDGTATYASKDIAFHLWKFGLLPDEMKYAPLAGIWSSSPDGTESGKYSPPASMAINIIGAEQAHPQKLIHLTLKLMGHDVSLFHVSYEHVWLPEGKFSGRKGTWLGYTVDEVLDEAHELARAEVEKRVPDVEEREKIASAVGSAAIRYTLIKAAPEKKITFRWEEALSFEGDAAPYLQYAHARACRILEKQKVTEFHVGIKWDDVHERGRSAHERALIKTLSKWPSLLSGIVRGMRTESWGTRIAVNSVAEYAYNLATSFSQFYTNCRVIGSDRERERLLLVAATRQTLANVLDTLGIEAIERM